MEQLKIRIKKPKGIIIGLICQYIILPITAFILTLIFKNISVALKVGLIIIATCPGGSLSNFWCFMFNADLPLSISMTSASSLLSFAFITMNGAIYIPVISQGKISIDYISLLISVSSVIVGIIAGLLIGKYAPKIILKFMAFLAVASMIGIFVFSIIGGASGEARLRDLPYQIFIMVGLLNIIGFTLAFGLARLVNLKRQSIVSVAIEASNQNAPLAFAILLLTLPDGIQRDLATNVPTVYMISNIVLVLIILPILRRTGWLQIDYDDKTLTFGKIIRQLYIYILYPRIYYI